MDREIDVNDKFGLWWEIAIEGLPVIVQNKDELRVLSAMCRGIETYLEIGTGYGISALCLGANARHVVCVDETKPQCADRQNMIFNYLNMVGTSATKLKFKSDEARNASFDDYWAECGEFDVVFIDGDHSYDQVKRDWENYGPLARKFVAFHDILLDDPGRLFDEIGGDLKIIGKDSEYGIGIKFS